MLLLLTIRKSLKTYKSITSLEHLKELKRQGHQMGLNSQGDQVPPRRALDTTLGRAQEGAGASAGGCKFS